MFMSRFLRQTCSKVNENRQYDFYFQLWERLFFIEINHTWGKLSIDEVHT